VLIRLASSAHRRTRAQQGGLVRAPAAAAVAELGLLVDLRRRVQAGG
jgi:hypothetical protein